MTTRTIRTVTIDLDGTLLDTVDDLADACNAMLLDLGRARHEFDQIARFVGKGMRVLVERCLDGEGSTDPALVDDGVAAFRRHYAEVNGRGARLYPGVREGLDALRDSGLRLACVTNKPAEFTAPLLERCGLAGYFSAVVSGDTLPVKKPDPAPILHACGLLGGSGEENVHIGDSIHDIEAALAAGSVALVVPYGYGSPMDSRTGAELVSDLVEAAAVVARLNCTEQSS